MSIAQRMPVSDEAPDVMLGVLGVVFGRGGESDAAKKMLEMLESRSRAGYSAPFWRALLYAVTGDIDLGFERLEEALEERDGGLLYLSLIPRIPGLQEDPRFASVLRRMGLGHLLPTI